MYSRRIISAQIFWKRAYTHVQMLTTGIGVKDFESAAGSDAITGTGSERYWVKLTLKVR